MDTVLVSQDFDQTVEEVWKALTDVEEMRKWFFENIPNFEARENFKTQFSISNEGRNFTHMWTVAHVEVPNTLKVVWKFLEYEGTGLVTYHLEPGTHGCILHLRDEIVKPFPNDIPEFKRESCMEGWKYFINQRLPDYFANQS